MLDLGSGDEKVKKVDFRKFLTPGYTTSGHVELYTVSSDLFMGPLRYSWVVVTFPDLVRFCSQVSVERGMSWEEATHAWAEQNGPDDGFYVQVWDLRGQFCTSQN